MNISKLYKFAVLAGALSLSSLAFAGTDKEMEKQKEELKQVKLINEPGQVAVTTVEKEENLERIIRVVNFEPDYFLILKDEKEKLQDVMMNLPQKGELKSIKIISWSDIPSTFQTDQKLSERHEELVERRLAALTVYLMDGFQAGKEIEVLTINMAEEPETIAQWFNTNKEELQSIFAKEEGKEIKEELSLIEELHNEGGPNKALVLFDYEPMAKKSE